VGTDAAADAGEGDGPVDEVQRFPKATLGHQGDVALDVDAAGTGIGAGSLPLLVDDGAAGLRAFQQVDGLVVGARHGHGADLDTVHAGRTPGQVHVAGMLAQLDLEAAGLPVEPVEMGTGPHGDVGVLGNLQQPGVQQVVGHGGVDSVSILHMLASLGAAPAARRAADRRAVAEKGG